jgi:hypothetical protein
MAEATSLSSLQFFALMQPGQAYIVVGHSMSTIYSTTTDVESLHGKIILFKDDHRGSRERIPIIMPKISAFQWKKCKVIDDKEKLCAWYSDNPSKHGKLWDPDTGAGTKNELFAPRMIALPLQAVSIYQGLKGGVMPHKLLNEIENHLASLDTKLDNGDEWGLVQKWLLIASQKDGGGGNPTKSKSHIALTTEVLLTNDNLIEHWISDRIDSMLGPRPDVSLQSGDARQHGSSPEHVWHHCIQSWQKFGSCDVHPPAINRNRSRG